MFRSWGTHLLGALFLAVTCCGCGEDDRAAAPDSSHSAQRMRASDAGAARDAGHESAKPTVPTDAGLSNAFPTWRYPSAVATLNALQDDAADGGAPWRGEAQFTTTAEGVDLQIKLLGCEGVVPLEILQASDCASRGAAWGDGYGAGIPALHCAGAAQGQAVSGYERGAKHEAPWSIGDGAASDVVGHVLVARDPETDQVFACGVIKRGPDVNRRPLPPADQAPSLETRAAIGGVCMAQQSSMCPDSAVLLNCQAVHCSLAECLDTCSQRAACLDQHGDACANLDNCPPSAGCVRCQSAMQQCALSYCAEHVTCGAKPTPDGP